MAVGHDLDGAAADHSQVRDLPLALREDRDSGWQLLELGEPGDADDVVLAQLRERRPGPQERRYLERLVGAHGAGLKRARPGPPRARPA